MNEVFVLAFEQARAFLLFQFKIEGFFRTLRHPLPLVYCCFHCNLWGSLIAELKYGMEQWNWKMERNSGCTQLQLIHVTGAAQC